MSVYSHVVDIATRRSKENLEALERTAANVRREIAQGDKVAQRYGDTAGRVGSSAGRLAGILDRVSPEMGELARLTADGADAFEVASMGGTTFLGVLGRVAAVVAPLAIAVGLLAGAYYTLKRQLDAANAAAELAVTRADAMADAHMKVREQALMAAVATGELSQEEFNRIAAAKTAGELFALQQQDASTRLRTAREEIVTLQGQREAVETLVTTLQAAKDAGKGTVLAGEGGIVSGQQLTNTGERLQLAQQQLDGLNASLQTQQNEARNAAVSMGILTTAQDRYADDLATVKNAPLEAAAGLEAQKTAAEAAAEAMRQLQRDLVALGAAFDALPNEDRLAGLRAAAGAFGPQAPGLSAQDQAGMLRAQLAAEMSRGNVSPDDYLELSGQIDAGDAAATAAARRSKAGNALGGVATGVGALSSPAGALSLLGPAGAIFGGLSALGGLATEDSTVTEGVEQKLDELLEGILGGLAALPEIIAEVLPEFALAIATELPPALLMVIPELISSFVSMWTDRKDVEYSSAQEAADGLASAALDAVSGGASSEEEDASAAYSSPEAAIKNVMSVMSSASRSSQAATTGRLARAGGAARLAMARSPTQRSMGGGGVHVNIQALGVDDRSQVEIMRRYSALSDPDTGLRGR
jgi:hypothetical protein